MNFVSVSLRMYPTLTTAHPKHPFSLLLTSVVVRCLGVCCDPPFLFWVVLFSSAPFLVWCCSSPRHLWVVLLSPLPSLELCCLAFPFLGGAAFLPLSCWMVLISLLLLWSGASFLSLLLLGASFPPPSFRWCCFSPLLLLWSGAAIHLPFWVIIMNVYLSKTKI